MRKWWWGSRGLVCWGLGNWGLGNWGLGNWGLGGFGWIDRLDLRKA